MKKKSKSVETRASDVSIDALIDDLFGLNLRALKTLWVSFRDPKSYAESAWSADWQDRYTPSFRLWFTLIAVLFFFQFLWAGDNSALIEFYSRQIANSGVALPNGVDPYVAATSYARVNFAILPMVSVGLFFVFAYVYRAWSAKTPFVVRARYVFLVIIPSTALSLPLFVYLGYAPEQHLVPLLAVSWTMPLLVDSWVASHSVFSGLIKTRRIVYSVALSVALLSANLASSIVSGALANYWIAYWYT